MSKPPGKWRLLRTYPAPGAWNMAVDEAILESTAQGSVPPTFRLYGWSPACISIGYAQGASDVDFERLTQLGWDVVRRPTGGRAILHTDELTYSISGPDNHPALMGSVLQSYQRISQALMEALRTLGIKVDDPKPIQKENEDTDLNPVCFEVPSNYEITASGKKLIGSAQARKKSGVLQHGSLPLYGDISRIIDVLNFPDRMVKDTARQKLIDHATTLEDVIGYKGDWWNAAYAFENAFGKVLNIKLHNMQLTPSEGKRAFELYNEKYNHSEWTLRK